MKKFERKHIKLGKAYIEDGNIKVVIKEQSHICEAFGCCTKSKSGRWRSFEASNGLRLGSVSQPAVTCCTIFMQGSSHKCNNIPLEFTTLNGYNKFVEAVEEYNEYFSKPQVKEMTMEELCKELGYEVKIKKEDGCN